MALDLGGGGRYGIMQLEVIVREPESRAHHTPILFVHGYWHTAWCWTEHFLPYFAQHGYVACAFSLRGHGASEGRDRLRWTSVADYVDDLTQVADQMSSPPILVGHSLGALVLQKYLESHPTPAAVFLASVPPQGVFWCTMRIIGRHPLPFLKSNLTFSPIHSVGTPELAREAFFWQDISEEELEKYFAHIQDDSYRAYLDMMVFGLPRPQLIKTPVLVMGAANDGIFTPAEVEATAHAYDTKPEIFSDMAHDMMLDPGWQAVADRVLGWLSEKGL